MEIVALLTVRDLIEGRDETCPELEDFTCMDSVREADTILYTNKYGRVTVLKEGVKSMTMVITEKKKQENKETGSWRTLGNNLTPRTIKLSKMTTAHLVNSYRSTKSRYLKLLAEGDIRGINLDYLILSKTKRELIDSRLKST